MSIVTRPVKKSPPIQFRIDIELWPKLVARAEHKDMTVNEYLRDAIETSLRNEPQV